MIILMKLRSLPKNAPMQWKQDINRIKYYFASQFDFKGEKRIACPPPAASIN